MQATMSSTQIRRPEPDRRAPELVADVGSAGTTAGRCDAMTNNMMRVETGQAVVNGIDICYEGHGRRDGVPLVPLVLLHAGGSTIGSTVGRLIRRR